MGVDPFTLPFLHQITNSWHAHLGCVRDPYAKRSGQNFKCRGVSALSPVRPIPRHSAFRIFMLKTSFQYLNIILKTICYLKKTYATSRQWLEFVTRISRSTEIYMKTYEKNLKKKLGYKNVAGLIWLGCYGGQRLAPVNTLINPQISQRTGNFLTSWEITYKICFKGENSEGLGVGERMILKWILEKRGVKVFNAFNWIRIWSYDGILRTRKRNRNVLTS